MVQMNLNATSAWKCFTKAFNTGAVVFTIDNNFEGIFNILLQYRNLMGNSVPGL